MSLSELFRRRHVTTLVFRVDDVCWGVKRRTGFSEIDDPVAHGTAPAHAYVAGNDRLALCGYRPYRRARQQPIVSLALPTLDNPECESCRSATSSALSLVVHPEVAGTVITTILEAIESPNPLHRLDELAPIITQRRTRRRLAALPAGEMTPRIRRSSGSRSRRKRSAPALSTSQTPVAVPVLVEMAVAS